MDYSSVVKPVVDYLLENNQKFAAQAIQNALGQVVSAQNGCQKNHSYSPSVNRYLCEALFFVNSDPQATTNNRLIIRKLLEEYRHINNMPTDDVDALPDEYISIQENISVEHQDLADFILENTERGEEYDMRDIEDAAIHYTAYLPQNQIIEDVSNAVRELVSMGYFTVTESRGFEPLALKRL